MRNTAKALAFIASLLPFAALGQSAPATLGYHTLYGRIGAVPGDTGPGQAIPWSTILSKSILDGVGTAQGTIPCRGASVWGPLVPGATGTLLASAGTTVCPGWISTVPVANGGTGNSTAAGARTGLNVESYTPHNDSNYAILATDRTVGTSAALTAPRTWTLPAASTVNPGQAITVADYFGGVSSVNTLTIARAGADTINGATTVVINAASGRYELRSDGVSKWSAMASGGSSSSTLTKAPSDYGAACDGSTDDSTAIQAWLTAISGNAFIGWVPPGKTCIFNGLLSISSGTTIYGYGGTFKLKNSGNANSGFVWGPTSQLGGPINNVTILGLTVDGNRANQTISLGTGAMMYVISASNVTLRDVIVKNSRGDGIYVGGDSSGNGVSSFVTIQNAMVTNSYRNNMSVVGLDRGIIIGGIFNGATNTTNDGPQCGIDFEPNGSTTKNTYITVLGVSASNNGGTLSTTGGSGLCIFNSSGNTAGLVIYGPQVTSNKNYGIDSFAAAPASSVRLSGVTGAGNGTALVDTTNIIDWFPTGIVKNSANSCGTGFACVGVPN